MSEIKVYHGSYCEVVKPSFDNGRVDTDFGLGFYVTPDFEMAEKWACRKKKPIINEYTLDIDKLKSHSFQLDEEWLNFVIQNRNISNTDFSPNQFDLLIGATADDKLFATIEQYESGFIDTETAVEALNCMKVGQQICIRTKEGLDSLHFCKSVELSYERVNEVCEINKANRKKANQLTSEILRNYSKEKLSIKDRIAQKQETLDQCEKDRDKLLIKDKLNHSR